LGLDLLDGDFIDIVTEKFKDEFSKIMVVPLMPGQVSQECFDSMGEFTLYCEIKELGGLEAFCRDREGKAKSGKMDRSTKGRHNKKAMGVLEQLHFRSGCQDDPFIELKNQIQAYQVARKPTENSLGQVITARTQITH